jgi:hypothetical protein
MHELEIESASDVARKRAHIAVLSVLAAVLSVSAHLKFGEIQYLEVFLAGDVVLAGLWVITHPRPFVLYRPLFRIGLRWAFFSLLAIALAIFNLRLEFPHNSFSAFKQPLVVSVARIAELALDLYMMLLLAGAYRRDRWLCKLGALSYFWAAVAGGIYSIYAALVNHGLFTYRFRGFDQEGGPYGIYLISAIFVALIVRSKLWISPWVFRCSMALFVVCMIGSRSKAAFFEIAVYCILIPALRWNAAKSLMVIAVLLGAIAFLLSSTVIGQQVTVYARAAASYQELSRLRPTDGNLVAGRVAGLFLAPKMIAAHPLSGIGLGNYPLIRNNPEFRRGTPYIEASVDSPSLGIIDYIVDFGIPLCLYFVWVEIAPGLDAMRRKANFGIVSMLLVPAMSMIFGAHLNLTYTWVAAAIGLGCLYLKPEESTERMIPLTLS